MRSYFSGAFALRGLVAILFGIVVLWRPVISLAALIIVFGIYALISGLITSVAAWAAPEHKGLLFLGGLFGIAVGILTFTHTSITVLGLVYFIAFLFLIEGVVALTVAIAGAPAGFDWVLGLFGAISILFSVSLMVSPASGAVALVYVLGLYAIFNGISLEVYAWQLRSGSGTVARA
jgi:uncharacterized membrane protein HdeD (DUF308 family)